MTTDTTTDEIDRTLTANEVRKMLDRLQNEGFNHTEPVGAFAKEIVETGTFTPDCRVMNDISLTAQERLLGKREQDMTPMLLIGMMLGSALERDVPRDSALEDAWREGKFELPGQ